MLLPASVAALRTIVPAVRRAMKSTAPRRLVAAGCGAIASSSSL